MDFAACCERRELRWTQSRMGDRFVDQCVCASCGHVHKREAWLAPIAWPADVNCVNCGGSLALFKGRLPARCEVCGLVPEKDIELHAGLAALHPDRNYLAGAQVAADLGRHTLALKLATAATRWGRPEDLYEARFLRLRSLEAIGFGEAALDEAYAWAHDTAPSSIWGVIAELEAATGNIDGAHQALVHGLKVDPGNLGMWLDFAELLVHYDDRPAALNAAAKGLPDPNLRPRALQAILDVAQRFYDDGRLYDVIDTLSTVGELQEQTPAIAWLLACTAAQQSDEATAVHWLETTLKLEPGHSEARVAYERLRPPTTKRAGWLPWR